MKTLTPYILYRKVNCRFCGTALVSDLVVCARCETPFHRDCWEIGQGGCSIFGCGGRLALGVIPGTVAAGESPRRHARHVADAPVVRDAFALEGFEPGPGGIHFDVGAEARLARVLASGAADDPEWFALRLEAERVGTIAGFDELISLKSIDVEPFEHQRETALRVLQRMRGLAILADDVGLGKTIEAGLIMKELILRGLARKILVLCPASLVSQWRSELLEKFREDFAVNEDGDGWFAPRTIASFDLAKRGRHKDAIHAQEYDLVVVDEAHKVQSSSPTLRQQLVEGIRKRYMLMLTATPVQNDLMELYRLVNVLKPGSLGTARAFRARYLARSGAARMVVDPGALRTVLAGVLVRNARSRVGFALPPRTVRRQAVTLSAPERALYEGVRAVMRRARGTERSALTIGVLASRICSSSRALAATLRVMARGVALAAEERAQLEELAASARDIEDDAKLGALHDTLSALDGRKCVVFTASRETLTYLEERLTKGGYRVATYHGGLDRFRRDVAVTAFQRDHPVFLATEAGAEGLNLQFASVVVNYDLPWNPMRLEQRIGRVHRLGQKQEVLVVNLTAADTVEDRLLSLLADKIRMFELVMGELGLLLGELETEESFEQLVARLWLDAPDEAAAARSFDELGNKILAARDAVEAGRAARKLSSEVCE